MGNTSRIRRWSAIISLGICALHGYSQRKYELPAHVSTDQIVPHLVVIKLATDDATIAALDPSRKITAKQVSALPQVKQARPLHAESKESSILHGIRYVRLTEGQDPVNFCNDLLRYDNILYAEPVFAEQLLLVPDDPEANPATGAQTYLQVIRAYDAWDISQGDENIVIGIVDTGIDLVHEDILNKLFLNENDPVDGIDNDNNGYLDDYLGYDFADTDNDAQADLNFHGNMVAGLAGAETNNGIGIAGIGFHSKLSPLKIFTSADNSSAGAYEAIVYAADNGYDILNLSWGSAGTFSQFNQDVINYAVLEKDVVIIAAAGNTPAELDFYPASYENVLSLASTTINDEKASFATYSYHVDVTAPGANIHTTFKDNGYTSDNGSSYSSPLAAGAAALVKEHYPSFNARQIMETLRVTSDDIYSVGSNSNFEGKLGKGRLNVYQALTADTLRSIRARNIQQSGPFSEAIYFGDSVSLSFELINFLGPVSQGSLSFSSPSPHISFPSDPIALTGLDTMDIQLYQITGISLSTDVPPETTIPIRLNFGEGGYHDFQYFQLTTAPDYVEFDNGIFALTLAGNGNLGFTDDSQSIGTGLEWNQVKLADHLGFMLAAGEDQVSDNCINVISSGSRERDFVVTNHIKFYPDETSDWQIASSFSDDSANQPIGLSIEQKVFGLTTEPGNRAIIMQYRVTNSSPDSLFNLSGGFYLDWDLDDASRNKAAWVDSTQVLIAQNHQNSLFTGVKIFQAYQPVFQALDIDSSNGNPVSIDDSFTDSIKYQLLKEQLFDSAGSIGDGNNIATLLSDSIPPIPPFDSRKLTFIISAANHPDSLLKYLEDAETSYQEILQHPPVAQTVSSCTGASPQIVPSEGSLFRFYSDPLGMNLIHQGPSLSTTNLLTDTSFYYQQIDSSLIHDIRSIEVELVEKVADFAFSPDTLFLGDSVLNLVQFSDMSFNAVSWAWDFGNETAATIANPSIIFDSAGLYEISLEITNELGCSDTARANLLVAQRPDPPIILPLILCPQETAYLKDMDADTLTWYNSPTKEILLATGDSIQVGPFDRDTLLYVTNSGGPFESDVTPVLVQVNMPDPSFICIPDVHSVGTGALLINTAVNNDSVRWLVDGEVLGNQDTTRLAVEKTNYQVQLIAYQSGCSDTLIRQMEFHASPVPVYAEITQPCLGSQFILEPTNGTFFAFYSDSSLTQLIQKGTRLIINSVSTDTTIYVVGLDSIFPGDYLPIHIVPFQPTLEILADPDTLILSQPGAVSLAINSTEPFSAYRWLLNDTLVETLADPLLFFNTAGLYRITLEATHANGCQLLDSITYPVISEPLLGISQLSTFHVYPNPGTGEFIISAPFLMEFIRVFDLSGNLILTHKNAGKTVKINLSNEKIGIYVVSVQGKNTHLAIRLIKDL